VLQKAARRPQLTALDERRGQVDRQLPSERRSYRQELARARDELDAPGLVVALERAAAGSGEPQPRPLGEPALLAELALQPERLLEVVADHLVELDEPRRVLLEPVGEPLVEGCAHALGKRRVRSLPDQRVAETERLVVRQERLLGPQELFADE